MKAGSECGMKIAGYTALEEGDVLVVFKEEKKIRSLA